MLESSSDWPTREWIERAVINQYERLESEQLAAEIKVMIAHGLRPDPVTRCSLLSLFLYRSWRAGLQRVPDHQTRIQGKRNAARR